MATVVLPRSDAKKLKTIRQYDNYFFSAMALLILTTVFVGFARTYFLAGVVPSAGKHAGRREIIRYR